LGRTLRRYLLREIGGAFLAGIAIFASILFLLRAIDLIEMIFARGVPAFLVVRLLGAILPSLVEVTLPMAFLLAVVTALGRMASDRETLALRAAGLNVWQILPPVVALALVVSLASLALSMTARPWGHAEIERTLFEIAKTRASAALKPRFFNTDFERMVVYVDHIEPDSGDLVGVLLSDERSGGERSTVFAHTGRVGGHEDSGRLYLQLLDGTSVSSRESYADYDVTKFRSLEVSLELRTATGDRPVNDEPAAMGWSELRRELAGVDDARAREAAIELHRRFSIAAAALSLGLFGAALGFVTSATTRGRSVGVSIAIILSYYAVLMLGVGIARAETLPPVVALWAPNLVLAALATWSLSRNAKDLPMLRERRAPAIPAGRARA
jgi:lipopolysaccharide export system permease protein